MTPTHHLLTLWNPSYAADAMDEHLGVLLDWAGRWRRGEAPDDEVYVWWGRSQFADLRFRLWDIRRLVADDTPAVIEEQKRLRHTRYHDRPVSLYGGMVDLPLIVTRPDEVRWFKDRDLLTDGHLWAEREAQVGPGVQTSFWARSRCTRGFGIP